MKQIPFKEIYPNIFHLKFKTQYLATDTFMRLQEFYESPFTSIQGNYFTREQYQDIYAKTYGQFDYHTKWSGFNVPGNIVLKFFDKFIDICEPVSDKECMLYDTVQDKINIWTVGKDKVNIRKDFYLIATYNNKDIDHEVAHGFYYLSKQYKKEIDSILLANCRTSLFKRLRIELLRLGYSKEVFRDEIQAYLATESYEGIIIPKKSRDFKIIKELKTIFKQHKKSSGETL